MELISATELPQGVLAYKRKLNNEEVLVVLNFTGTAKEFSLPGNYSKLLSLGTDDRFDNGNITLGAPGGLMLKK